MRVIYYQLEATIELSYCGKSKDQSHLNCLLQLKIRFNKKNKSKTLIFKMKNRSNRLEYQNLNRKKKKHLKPWMTSKNKKMKETSSWLLSPGKEPSKNLLKYLIKVQEKLPQQTFNSNLLMDTEQKIVEATFDMWTKMLLLIIQLGWEF